MTCTRASKIILLPWVLLPPAAGNRAGRREIAKEHVMEYKPPRSVELTDEEASLNEQIPSLPDRGLPWGPIADAMESLFKSLIQRDAIPAVRLRVFDDPKQAEKRGKSPKQVFESNGTCGDHICRHPNFIKYLRYFINGPDLPSAAIKEFCRILNDDQGTSGMILDQLRRYVRSCVREYRLDRHSAGSQFYRLAVELGIDHDPHVVRTAAMSTR